MKVKVWKAVDGWRWNAKAKNNKIVAESGEAYTRKADCRRALKDLALEVLGMLTCLALLCMFVGCTSTKAYNPETGRKVLDRQSFLQKSDIKRIKIDDWEMEGYRNDGGIGALGEILALVTQMQGQQFENKLLEFQLQQAREDLNAPARVVVSPTPVPPGTVILPGTNGTVIIPPVVTNAPVVMRDSIDISTLASVERIQDGHPFDPREAKVDMVLRGARYQGSMIIFDYEGEIPYEAKEMGGWNSYAGAVVIWEVSPVALSGWFDHFASRTKKDRDTKNWRNGYLSTEVAADRAHVFIVSNDGKHRSNIVRITGTFEGDSAAVETDNVPPFARVEDIPFVRHLPVVPLKDREESEVGEYHGSIPVTPAQAAQVRNDLREYFWRVEHKQTGTPTPDNPKPLIIDVSFDVAKTSVYWRVNSPS